MSWARALQWLALVRTWLRCVVIGSGAYVTVVAPVDNALRNLSSISEIIYSRYHCSPNKCDVAHHWTTQQPCWKSQVSLILVRRDIWGTDTHTHRQTDRQRFLAFIEIHKQGTCIFILWRLLVLASKKTLAHNNAPCNDTEKRTKVLFL